LLIRVGRRSNLTFVVRCLVCLRHHPTSSKVRCGFSVRLHSSLRKAWFPWFARSAGKSILGGRCGRERDCYETLCPGTTHRSSNVRIANNPGIGRARRPSRVKIKPPLSQICRNVAPMSAGRAG
jgi:hypothetical protein